MSIITNLGFFTSAQIRGFMGSDMGDQIENIPFFIK